MILVARRSFLTGSVLGLTVPLAVEAQQVGKALSSSP